MSNELKSCPFCGGEAEIIEVKDNPPETIAIQCKSGCGVSVHNKWMEENVLIERWNTRVEKTCEGCVHVDSPDHYPCCCCSRDDREDRFESKAVN